MTAGPAADSYKRPESVLVVVTSRTGEVLLLQRADATQAWQSVTGGLLWSEQSPLEAARRELAEETGLAGEGQLRDWRQTHTYEIHPLWRPRYAPDVTHNVEHVFSLELEEPVAIVLNPAEHSDYCWCPFAEAIEVIRFPTNRQVVQSLYETFAPEGTGNG